MTDVTGYEETLSDNGSTTETAVVGRVFLSLSGTFGGGTVAIERRGTDGTWRALATASYTSAVEKVLRFPPNSVNKLRATLSGATSPTLRVTFQGSSLLLTG